MELIRYLLKNILRRPARAAFIIVAGFLSSAVLIFAFALGAEVTEHIRTDTIAKWTGHLWVSRKDDFEFKEETLASYSAQAKAVRDYLEGHPNTDVLVPWAVSYDEMQAGTAREFVMVTATDFERDVPYREHTELVAGTFPGPDDEYGALVTTVEAEKHRLKVGDGVTLFIPSAFGARNAMEFVVMGVYRASAPWYDEGITVRAQDYITMTELGNAFPFYKVYVKDERGIAGMVQELSAKVKDFPVKGYRDDQFVRFLLSLGTSNVIMFGTMAMIVFLALLIGIHSIMLTNIFDRREEIGTLRSLGFARTTVRNLFVGESLACLFLGYVLGAGAVAAIGAYFQSAIVRPPLLMLQYMFGMTRMAIDLNFLTLTIPFLLLFAILLLTTLRTVGRETEKQAAAQMASR